MKVLIFGGSGFLGKSIRKLFDIENIEYSTVSRSNSASNYKVDISNYEDFKNLPSNYFDIVVNCATILPGGNFLDSEYLQKIYNTNILGTQNICKWIDGQISVKHIINCSTLVVVGKPWPLNLNEETATYPSGSHVLYCTSKLTQELIFKTFSDTKNIILSQIRFSALYGEKMPWSGIICNLIDQARVDSKIILKNGNKVTADFLYADDAAKIILSAIINKYNGILNGASGEEVSLIKLAFMIGEKFDKEVEVLNRDDTNFLDNRANVSVKELKNIIDVKEFISISEGVEKMIQL